MIRNVKRLKFHSCVFTIKRYPPYSHFENVFIFFNICRRVCTYVVCVLSWRDKRERERFEELVMMTCLCCGYV